MYSGSQSAAGTMNDNMDVIEDNEINNNQYLNKKLLPKDIESCLAKLIFTEIMLQAETKAMIVRMKEYII